MAMPPKVNVTVPRVNSSARTEVSAAIMSGIFVFLSADVAGVEY